MNYSELLRDIVFNGIEKDLYEAEEIFALMDVTNEDENIATINKGKFGNFFVINEMYLARQLVLCITKIYEKNSKNSRYQIRSVPAALDIMRNKASELEILNRLALERELEALGCAVSNLNSFSSEALIGHTVEHFEKKKSESNLKSALDASKNARDKHLAHHEAIKREDILLAPTYEQLRELIETAKQFINVMRAVCGSNNYSAPSSSGRAARCLKRLFRTLNDKQYWEE
ncbi:MAG: hypothetical protein WCA07_02205 [Gloeobacterales cyanobacterium]